MKKIKKKKLIPFPAWTADTQTSILTLRLASFCLTPHTRLPSLSPSPPLLDTLAFHAQQPATKDAAGRDAANRRPVTRPPPSVERSEGAPQRHSHCRFVGLDS